MVLSRWALSCALAASFIAATTYAQAVRQPASTQEAAYDYEYSNYYSQDEESAPSPSDTLIPSNPEQPTPSTDAAADGSNETPSCGYELPCCDQGGGYGCDRWLTLGGLLDPCATVGEPRGWFDDCCCTNKCGIDVWGWAGQSFTWNTTNPTDRFNGPVVTTDRSNDWQLNQLYFIAERATSDDGSWDLGGRVDLLYGTDNRFTTAAGLETQGFFTNPKWTSFRFYGPALPQLYAQVRKGDLTVNIGHFYAPVGYEFIPMISNFFPNLSYTYIYGEPITFTGVIGRYQVADGTTVGGGFTRGWDNWGDGADYRNPHLGGLVTLSQALAGGTLNAGWTFGPENTQAAGFRDRFLQTLVWVRPLQDNWSMVLQSDLGYQNDAVITGDRDAYWYGLNGYLFKKISDAWTWGLRAEWFRDQDGARVGGFLGQTDNGSLRGLSTTRTGYAGNFYELSLGANWKPNANWLARPYVRFDWFDGNTTANNVGGKPFDNGNGNSQSLIGFDLLYLF